LNIEIKGKPSTLKITLLSLAVLSLFAVTPASFASTSHPIYASGNFTSTITPVSVNVGTHMTTIFATITDVLTGTVSVTYVGTITLHEYASGVCTYQTRGVATGTISSSKAGTAIFAGSGSAVCVTGGGAEGTGHYTDGTGGLAGIRGWISIEGMFTSATAGAGTYQGILYLG
jgi:hypothetical protein